MRKVISEIVLIFFLLVYLLSSNDYLLKKIVPYRYDSNSIFSSDKYRYGDLFGFSYLIDFKIPKPFGQEELSYYSKPGKVNLYMICDSYLWTFIKSDSVFCNVNKLSYVRWLYGEQVNEQLDTTKPNILIIEVAERQMRKLLCDTDEMYSSMHVYKNSESVKRIYAKETFWEKLWRYLYNEKINQNLEFNLFDYRFITPVRELKASLNYRIFNRVDKDVTISANKRYLFYGPTTDSVSNTSSFSAVSEQEINNLVTCINNAYYHFKSLGFDEIYLSIVPNPVTIIEPDFGKHNALINKIQDSKELVIPIIDVLPLFKDSQKELYCRSDSHWNYDGLHIWIDETNKMLQQYKSK